MIFLLFVLFVLFLGLFMVFVLFLGVVSALLQGFTRTKKPVQSAKCEVLTWVCENFGVNLKPLPE
jgi:uncharacterized protein YpmB